MASMISNLTPLGTRGCALLSPRTYVPLTAVSLSLQGMTRVWNPGSVTPIQEILPHGYRVSAIAPP